MIAKIHIPAAPLNQFIEYFFYYTGFNPEHSIDRFLPDGDVQIIFDLTDYPKYIYDNYTFKEIQSCRNVWFSGFRTKPITIPSGKESEMLIILFRKGKAFPFVCEPMHALKNLVVDAELVIKSDILDIREKLLNTESVEQKFLILENDLLRFYSNKLRTNSFIDFAVSKIVESPNKYSISEIAQKAGYTQKHIISMFKSHAGVTPKEFLKVIRFQKAIKEIEKKNTVDWIHIAYDSGYYDQSHFISDFKFFSGFTPSEYIKLKGGQLNYIAVK